MSDAPYLIGSGTSVGAVTTTVITTSTGTAAGDTIVVTASLSATGFKVTQVTDSAGNVYQAQPLLGGSSTTQNPTFAFVSPGPSGGPNGGATAALAPGSTITATWNTNGGTRIAVAVGCSGLLTGITDQNPASTSAASGTAASITSGPLNYIQESCIAVVTNGNAGGSSGTWAAGWTVLLAPTLAGSLGQYTSVASQVVTSESPVTASFTLGASSKWCMLLMTFADAVYPYVNLDVKGQIYLGSWTDATSYMLLRDPISIQRGRPDESSQINPTQVNVTLDNHDGRWSVRNPLGAWYGQLVQNTPLRLSVPSSVAGLSNSLRLEDDQVSYVSTGPLNITASIDIRVDMNLSGYYSSAIAEQAIAGSGNSFNWLFQTDDDGTLAFFWLDSGSAEHAVSSGVRLPYLGRIAVRVTLDTTTGNVTFYTAPTMAGSWTTLATIAGSGATNILYTSGAVLCCGGQNTGGAPFSSISANGRIYEMQVYSGIAGTLKADPQFYNQTAGVSSFTDGQSNTWTMQGTAEISDRLYRAHAELASVPKAAEPSQRSIYSEATAYGLMHRLQQGNAPVISAWKRYNTTRSGNLAPAAYWPGEDPEGSTQIASGLPGGSPMSLVGTPVFQAVAGSLTADSNFACSAQLPQVGTSIWTGPVSAPSGFTWTDNVTRFLMFEPAGDIPNGTIIATVRTTGTIARLDLDYETGGNLGITGWNSAGTQLFNTGYGPFPIDGSPVLVSLDLIKSGSNITYQVQTLPAAGGSTETISGTQTSASVGAVTSVIVNPRAANMSSAIIGHVSVQGKWVAINNQFGEPLNAWLNEPAGMRFARLCTENGVNSRVFGFPSKSVAMGFQTIDTLPNLLQQIENTDLGMLYEPREALALGYATCAALCNQSADSVVDFSASNIQQGFSPTADDLLAINDVTANNNGGTSSQQVLSSGPMSIQAPPNGIGRISTSTDVYAASDAQTADLASWALHTRSVNEDRFPSVPLQMARTSTPRSAIVLDIGGYIQVTNAASWAATGTVRQLAAGLNEQLGPAKNWPMEVNGIPESPYEVAIGGTSASNSAHGDTSGAQLSTSAAASATSLSVSTTSGPLWTTHSADFPFDIVVAGERMTVTNITGSSSPQTFTVTRSVNGVVKAQAANAPVSLFNVPAAALS